MASTDNKASIALLRRLRAGEHVHFVHHVDVCAAVPEILVADLEPVPGTGMNDDGYSRIWYFFHAKKYKNSRGDTSGHRQRAVTGGGGTGWHSERAPVDVDGSGGGTFFNLSYGRKIGKSIDRMGWCMIEYDLAAADKQPDEAAAADDASNYVLCKVYRSLRAKEKSASSSSKKQSSKQTARKRKAGGGGDHPEAPPAKLIQQPEPQETGYCYQPEYVHEVVVQQPTGNFNCYQPEYVHQEPQVQQETGYCYQPEYVEEVAVQKPTSPGGNLNFNFDIGGIDFYVDESMLRDEPEPGLQHQPIAEPEQQDGQFIQLPCGPVFSDRDLNMEEFSAGWLMQGQPQLPIAEPPLPPGHGGSEFIQMSCGLVLPVVPEATVDDMLEFGPETLYGQWSGGGMATATSTGVPSSSYAPTKLYTGCSSLLQGPDPLGLPYLTC